MIEVLVTILIVTLGLLGIAALFARSQQINDEAYQRFQALHIARKLAESMSVNTTEATNGAGSAYVAANVDADYAAPSGASAQVATDMTNFKNALVGAGLVTDKLALVGAIGCVDYVDRTPTGSAPDLNYPRVFYRISVAWTGRQATGAPQAGASNCGFGIVGGGDEALRRVVSYDVQV